MEKKSYTFDEIKQKMVNYCVYQDRCHSEIEQKMRDFLLIPEAKEEIYSYLIQENYLNEERFTRSYIRGKFYMKQWGKNKIKIHLMQKGITEKLFLRCLDEIHDEDYHHTLRKLYHEYFQKLKGLKDYQKRVKTTRYLLGKGYTTSEIVEVISP